MTGAQVNPMNAREGGGERGGGGGAEYSCMVHSVPATYMSYKNYFSTPQKVFFGFWRKNPKLINSFVF